MPFPAIWRLLISKFVVQHLLPSDPSTIIKHPTPLDEHKHTCGTDTFVERTLESLPKTISGNVMILDFS
jgi:hypothetical protein